MKELFRNEIVRKAFLSDILGIPEEEIRTARLLNPFLRKRYKKQKLGILDILLELNDDTRINIEIQLKASSSWDRRQIFYLSKLFTSDLKVGENYSRLKRCIGISILDFNLTDRPEYHSIYFLQDEKGNRFSDVFEIHTIELKKKLMGNEAADDWIRLFNAESEEDLEMIKTEKAGLREAIREVKRMSLSERLRARYEEHMKYIRDKAAREDYVWQQGRAQGRQEEKDKIIAMLIADMQEDGKKQRAGTGQTAAAVCADGAGSGRVFGTFLEMTNMPAAEEKGIAYGR